MLETLVKATKRWLNENRLSLSRKDFRVTRPEYRAAQINKSKREFQKREIERASDIHKERERERERERKMETTKERWLKKIYLDNNKDVRRAKDARVDAAPGSPFWLMSYKSFADSVDSREMHAMLRS